MQRARAVWRRLNGVDIAQLHAKAWGTAWSIALFLVTPRVLGDALGPILVGSLCGLMFVGSIVSAVGLVTAARNRDESLRTALPRTVQGLLVELFGVMLMMIALVLYALTQAALSFGPEGAQRLALCFLASFTAAMVLGRAVSVLHRRRKEIASARAAGIVL
ncbi:hypothetical protein [Microbacterium sp.]|jgi:hypothetical protein|uniref:hypothetical protein n=1 Tax=Microbacterium sp. TaxID=51671 RepID=UPI0037CB9FA3